MSVLSPGIMLGFRSYYRTTHLFSMKEMQLYQRHPLHVSAGNNMTEIVKCLLEWKGNDKVDLEAKNMYGETPMHLAASLSKIPESGKLRELLNSYQEEQRKKKALEACSKEKEKMDALEKELSYIVGLDELKMQLRKWAIGMLLDKRRKALGLQVGTGRLPQMTFPGNPGTAEIAPYSKTMVARILGRLLHSEGILPSDKVKEVQRTDLVAKYIWSNWTTDKEEDQRSRRRNYFCG